jgi:hypothetical protein
MKLREKKEEGAEAPFLRFQGLRLDKDVLVGGTSYQSALRTVVELQ